MGTSTPQVVKIVLFLGAWLVGRKFKPGSYKLARLLPTRLISCNNILSGSWAGRIQDREGYYYRRQFLFLCLVLCSHVVRFLGAWLVGRKVEPGSCKLARPLPTRLISCNNILFGSWAGRRQDREGYCLVELAFTETKVPSGTCAAHPAS